MEHSNVGRGCGHQSFNAVAHSGTRANAQPADVSFACEIRAGDGGKENCVRAKIVVASAQWEVFTAPVNGTLTHYKMSNAYKITGNDAVRLAQRENLTVGIDGEGAAYVIVTPTGWRNAQGNHCDGEGRTVEAYFDRYTGEYFGPDDDGVEPCWNDAVN